jgi:hypothetical protein
MFMIKQFHDETLILKSRLGHSKKGWVDGEIGALWIKDFDEKTRVNANGRKRLLLVDGHNSHYTRAFLEYARAHNIDVLCYPAHATHVYQGLDVAVFGSLKIYWSQERDKYERENREKVTKENFLAIYAKAHIRALTPETIRSAFRKTGSWPFNPNVITTDMMAPSLETTCQGSLPLVQATPIRIITKMFQQLAAPIAVHGSDSETDHEDNDIPAAQHVGCALNMPGSAQHLMP